MSTPTLTDGQLQLVPMTENHISDEYLSWLNNKSHMHYSRQRHFQHSRETSLAYRKTFLNSANHFWAMEEALDEPVLVGTMTAYVDNLAGVADVGILVSPTAKGRGYGKRAWGLVLAYLFEDLKLRKVTAGTVKGNSSMERIALGWNMQLEGVFRQQELIDGIPHDILRYGLLAQEWHRNSQASKN